MVLHVGLPAECSATVWALEGPLTAVGPEMSQEKRLAIEALFTAFEGTAELGLWLFSSVNSKVFLELRPGHSRESTALNTA